jgi:hypothetical protein
VLTFAVPHDVFVNNEYVCSGQMFRTKGLFI